MMLAINDSPETWDRCVAVVRPALLLAPTDSITGLHTRLSEEGVAASVAQHDTSALFDWIIPLLARQGISNHAAEVFIARHGSPTFAQITDLMAGARCPRLRCWWSFSDCGYRRSAQSCGTPHHLLGCPVTFIPARKGTLAEAAVGFWLFVCDVAEGDLVGWMDRRLSDADPGLGDCGRDTAMRDALLEPLVNIPGTGSKVWSMILAELFLGADPDRERWVTTGTSFNAIDSLVHAHLHRTGILRRLDAVHAYGPACYEPGGCADVIAALARRVDGREFDKSFPAYFPRWVQFALWWFCAEGGWSICNANKIDTSGTCGQKFCPTFSICDRLALGA